MPRPSPAQLAYGSVTVVCSTLAMLLSQTRSGGWIVVIVCTALALGLFVAVTAPTAHANLRRRRAAGAAARAASGAASPSPARAEALPRHTAAPSATPAGLASRR
ncbi:hypothetical protein QLX52_05610 [Streptomyces albus]|uniref:hypothetical protein n=1 Tax=Streptomyces albus TaxID=1888 RepID=UPI0024AD94CA|nr:hypothetical protein [Streptomyces albus]MDI6408314.1 hypothetical protein [Streptomyces albus]